MKINVYKNQKEIDKTFEVEAYDMMYGTVEDALKILEGIDDMQDSMSLAKVIMGNREKINELILDVFGPEGMVKEDLRNIKVKELVPFFVELFSSVQNSFDEKN